MFFFGYSIKTSDFDFRSFSVPLGPGATSIICARIHGSVRLSPQTWIELFGSFDLSKIPSSLISFFYSRLLCQRENSVSGNGGISFLLLESSSWIDVGFLFRSSLCDEEDRIVYELLWNFRSMYQTRLDEQSEKRIAWGLRSRFSRADMYNGDK